MWKLEMVVDNERPSYVAKRRDFLRRDFPSLQEITHSTLFVIFGCERPAPLSDEEKALLDSYLAQRVIHRFRCKRM